MYGWEDVCVGGGCGVHRVCVECGCGRVCVCGGVMCVWMGGCACMSGGCGCGVHRMCGGL